MYIPYIDICRFWEYTGIRTKDFTEYGGIFMKWKIVIAIFFLFVFFLQLYACSPTNTTNNENPQQQTESGTASSEQGEPVTDSEKKEFEKRALYLYSDGIYPELWWAEGSNAINIGDDLDRPLDLQIPETEFYYIDRFQSIDELKSLTEQVFTKEYVQTYLYPYAEQRHMFVEYEGEVYANAYWEHTLLCPPERVEFLRKEGDLVYLSSYYRDLDGKPFSKEIQLKNENGVWKFHRTQLTEFFEERLSDAKIKQ